MLAKITTKQDRKDFLLKLHNTQKGITVKINALFVESILKAFRKKEKIVPSEGSGNQNDSDCSIATLKTKN